MKKTTEERMSRLRQQMAELGRQYDELIGEVLGRGPLVRGTLNWHERASGRYPGLTRGEGGKVVGRRVRLEHLKWLEPLLARHRTYRRAEARLRTVHRQVMEVAEALRHMRLYDYEPSAEASAYLVKVEGGRHGA